MGDFVGARIGRAPAKKLSPPAHAVNPGENRYHAYQRSS
jgi:hypothetical protein